jgi:sentrin-specific protease 8
MPGGSGSHWSLLVISTNDRTAFHYDSSRGTNLFAAKQVIQKINQGLSRPLQFQHLKDTPQQNNNYDCGVYVCCIMQHLIVKRLLQAARTEMVSVSMAGRTVHAARARREILNAIAEVRQHKQEAGNHSKI